MYLFLIIYLLLNYSAIAQDVLVFKVTNGKYEPIELVTISINDTIIGKTDKNGVFVYQYFKNKINIKLSCIGYYNLTDSKENFKDSLQYILKEKIKKEETVVISSRNNKQRTIGNKNHFISTYFHLAPNMSALTKINLKKYKSPKILSLNYFLKEGKNEDVTAPFKVLLFDYDTSCQCPGKTIIDNYIVASNVKNQWFSVSLKNENIFIENNYVYVGLQMMPESFYDKFNFSKYYKKFTIKEYKMPSISYTIKGGNNSYIKSSYANDNNKSWTQVSHQFLFTITIEY